MLKRLLSRGNRKVFTEIEAKAVRALADTVMPGSGEIAIDVDAIDVVGYIDDLLAGVPAKERFLLRCLFGLFEVQTLVTVPLGFRRFSQCDRETQTNSLRAWDQSNIYFRRLAFQSLRSVVLWAYVDNPGVEEMLRDKAATAAETTPADDDEERQVS